MPPHTVDSPTPSTPGSAPRNASSASSQPRSSVQQASKQCGVHPDTCVIAIASGKGGVGKTTTAVNLGFALSDKGFKVGILDADLFGPSIPLLVSRTEPIEHPRATDVVVPPTFAGVKVISIAMFQKKQSPNVWRGPMAGSMVKQFFTNVQWGELDYLLIDYPPGTSDIQLTLSQVARLTGAVLVTTPQDVALLDVEKAMAMLAMTKVPIIGIIETMSHFICSNCQTQHYLFLSGGGEKLAKKYDVPMLAQIPMESRIALTSDRGLPLVRRFPQADGAVAYVKAAESIISKTSKATEANDDNFHLRWK
ncbi:MAG: Mrp/NBP35 family ATP-binding protein [Pseudomonadota bacterium]|nr:Mrp/NBP35 family ATP-binding protein [Pseudomonadota bacterium]